MSGPVYQTLSARYPCCTGRALLLVLPDRARQTYRRRCPRCGRPWRVLRVRLSPASVRAMINIIFETGPERQAILYPPTATVHLFTWERIGRPPIR